MSRYFLPHIDRMAGYVPGEQPRDGGFIKLNTNENPYPPSPRVAEAIAAAARRAAPALSRPAGHRLPRGRRAPARRRARDDPGGQRLRRPADDPHPRLRRAGRRRRLPVAELHPLSHPGRAPGRPARRGPVPPDWTLDPQTFAVPGPELAFLANPNSPSGTALDARRGRASSPSGSTARWSSTRPTSTSPRPTASAWSRDHPNVIVTRTLQQGLQPGRAPARLPDRPARDRRGPDQGQGLVQLRHAEPGRRRAALEDQDYLAETRAKILATRGRLTDAVRALGYHVPESQANFVWCTGDPRAVEIYQALKDRKILVRLMRYPGHPDGLADHRRHRRRDRPVARTNSGTLV